MHASHGPPDSGIVVAAAVVDFECSSCAADVAS